MAAIAAAVGKLHGRSTVDLQWQLAAPPVEGEGKDRDWEEIYQQLLLHIGELMETLRGKEAP